MRTHGLPFPTYLVIPLLAVFYASNTHAAPPSPSKYPLRVHILATDTTYPTPRINTAYSPSCDTATLVAFLSQGSAAPGGISGDPCSIGPDFMRGGMLDPQTAPPVFSGSGRADLVTPPSAIQGFSFQYEGCSRIRVFPGFQSLPARWKKPGSKLEVLIPTDDVPEHDRVTAPARCTFTITLHDFVYLRLSNGAILQVAQDAFWKKPVLRVFLSGGAAPLETQPAQFTVAAHPRH